MRIYNIALVLIILTLFFICVIAQFNITDDRNQKNPNDDNNTTVPSDKIVLTVVRRDSAATKSGIAHLYETITEPIFKFIRSSKVTSVIRNVGVCAVNGFMEIISFYLPAPMIPLIATVAGLVIPFEPIVMLKHKMPVTSYRRAFQTAVNGFIKTFDKYKVDADYDDDPYMTRRFNRRFMNAPNDPDKSLQKQDTHVISITTDSLPSNDTNNDATIKCTKDKENDKSTETEHTVPIKEKVTPFSIINHLLIGPFIQFLQTTKLCKVFKSIWACTIHAFTEMINEYLPVSNDENV